MGNKAHTDFFLKKINDIAHKCFDDKNKHIKDFGDQIWKLKHISEHIKGFNMSKIKHMKKNSRIFRKILTMLLKQLVYIFLIFSVLEKILAFLSHTEI